MDRLHRMEQYGKQRKSNGHKKNRTHGTDPCHWTLVGSEGNFSLVVMVVSRELDGTVEESSRSLGDLLVTL